MLDAFERFSKDQTITSSAKSTNKIDRKKGGRDFGAGQKVYLVVEVIEDVTTASSGSIAIKLETDDNEAMSTPTQTLTVGTLVAGSAPKGTTLIVPVPAKLLNEQYYQIDYAVTGSITGNKITSYFANEADLWKAYPKGFTGPTT